jgi:hypothetical protein
MYFQNIEFYETENFQYLLIHKNACSSVLKCIEHLSPKLTQTKSNTKIKWTIIRDPYERFLSGLNYDLKRQNVKYEDIDLKKIFYDKINIFSRPDGNVNHCISQFSYIINADIDFYVDINDLDIFLKMHFEKSLFLNKDDKKDNIIVEKKDVMEYLNFDYYMYNSIMNSNNLWKWQNGKIF